MPCVKTRLRPIVEPHMDIHYIVTFPNEVTGHELHDHRLLSIPIRGRLTIQVRSLVIWAFFEGGQIRTMQDSFGGNNPLGGTMSAVNSRLSFTAILRSHRVLQ